MSGEKKSYDRFRSKMKRRRDRIDRVENPIVPGMPDVSCCFYPRAEIWIENKSPVEPKRDATRLFGSNHKVEQSQINWFRTQLQSGGNCAFWIDTDKRSMLIGGEHCEVINEMTVNELEEIAIWSAKKPTPTVEWENLRKLLLSYCRKASKMSQWPTK